MKLPTFTEAEQARISDLTTRLLLLRDVPVERTVSLALSPFATMTFIGNARS